jgi:TonB-linked SusC/RagA family outer membrane protein
MLLFACLKMSGQNDIRISGTVSDSNGSPLAGVVIQALGADNKTITDIDGKYTLITSSDCYRLRFLLVGYKTQEADYDSGNAVNITLDRAETYNLDDEVLMGFTKQRRGDVTGAVSTVKGDILDRTPAPNLGTALHGRLPGLITREISSEPSRVSTSLWSRGASTNGAYQPLLVIDGFTYRDYATDLLEYVSAMEIESISLLKDASTQALYGVQGGNGVLVITTKRGIQRKVSVDVRIDDIVEEPSTTLDFIPSSDYVQLKNLAGYNDGLGEYYFFDRRTIEGFINGSDKNLYPNNNWRELNMKDRSNMQRINANFTGGNEKAVFFTNLNVMHQDGMWKTDQTKYNSNNDYIWANFRSNVDVKLHKNLSIGLNLSGNIKRERGPGSTPIGETFGDQIYYRLYTVPPYVYGPTTPIIEYLETGEITGGQMSVTTTEPYSAYAVLNRGGYKIRTNTNIYAQFFSKLNLDFLTKGLSISGFGGYQTLAVGNMNTGQNFEKWIRTDNYNELEFTSYGTDENTPLVYSKTNAYYYNLNFKGLLEYHRTFGQHNLKATAFSFYQRMEKNDESLPYMRLLSGFEAAYSFADKYLLKFDVGYSGTEAFARQHRFVTTPAISAGWVISNEAFLKDNVVLTCLKPRVSIGKTANDQGLDRYVYLDNVSVGSGGPISNYRYLITEKQAANPNIAPETSVKQNIGLDIALFNNLSVSIDVFKERMNTMFSGATSSVPMFQGIPLTYYPRTNAGKFENKGYEISGDFTKQLAKDLSVNLGGWVMYAKNTIIFNDEANRGDDYAFPLRQEGFSYGQVFGYRVDYSNGNGFFNSEEEIANSNLTYEIGDPRVGDLKYFDLNNDGIINEKDKAPLGYGYLPRYTYAFNGGFSYKNFDLTFMFQGVGQLWDVDMGNGRVEYTFDGIFTRWHLNSWTPERYAAGEKISYPTLSTTANSNHETNEFFMQDKSYLRLKNAEMGYTFPRSTARAIRAQKIRIFLSGQNLYTWHNMTADDYSPDGSMIQIPPYKLYNIGLSVKF